MKYRRYKLIAFYEEEHDSEFGRAWVIVANSADLDPNCDFGFPETDLYGDGEFSELFIAPYDSTVIDELEGIAQSGELWSPEVAYWPADEKSKLIDGIHIISHHYTGWANGKVVKMTKSNHRIVSWKPLQQLITEQQSKFRQLKYPNKENRFFECGNVKGTISPLAAKMLLDENATMADFKAAMVSINGTTPLPYILPALNPNSKIVKTPDFYVERLLELGLWRDAFIRAKKNMEDNLELFSRFSTNEFEVFDSFCDRDPMVEEERSIKYQAFINLCTTHFLPTINNLLNIFKSAVLDMDSFDPFLNYEPEIEGLKKTVDSMLDEQCPPMPPAQSNRDMSL